MVCSKRDKELLGLWPGIRRSLQGIHSAPHCSHFHLWMDPLRLELPCLSSEEGPFKNTVAILRRP